MYVKDIVLRLAGMRVSNHVVITVRGNVPLRAVMVVLVDVQMDVLVAHHSVLDLVQGHLIVKIVPGVVWNLDVLQHVNMIAIIIVLARDVDQYVDPRVRGHVMLTVD